MKFFISFLLVFFCLSTKAQQTKYVDFKKADVSIRIDTLGSKIIGNVNYVFDVLKPIDSIYLDARKIKLASVFLNGDIQFFKNDSSKIWLHKKFKASKDNELSMMFTVSPKKAIYFTGWNDEAPSQIWTQGQGKYTSNWLPSIDDVNDKIEFDLSVIFDNEYEVIANGKLINKEVGEERTKWQYDMQQPMSSYLVALVIGKYDKKVETSKGGIPLEMYYYPEDSAKVEPTYRYTKQMFDFLEEEIGVSYPWQNYKQIPVHDFLYAGMENTSCTIFSDAFMVDEIGFADKNFVNVNAHELAHQWFGDLVTAKSSEHHWLQEGFATYYALLAEREIFGEDYYYWRLYEYAQELIAQDEAGQSTALINPKSSSLTFYKKGAWTLHMLREKIGDKAFKLAVKNYLEKYQYKSADTWSFFHEAEKVSGVSLSEFVALWLESINFPKYVLVEGINNDYTATAASFGLELIKNAPDDFRIIDNYDNLGYRNKHVISILDSLDTKRAISIYKEAFKSTLKTRQAIAQYLKRIPPELKEDYESLLTDKSYITIESALFNLINNYPEDAKKYLEQTKTIVGFNNKNVRLIWLVLAITSDAYSASESEAYINELIDYTNPKYNYEVRMSAFQYLRYISSCGETCQENLQQATTHHNWRMVKFAKETLKQINSKN